MESIPKEAFDDGIRFPTLEQDLELSDAAKRGRRLMKKENSQAKPHRFKREAVLESFWNTFKEIGGDPRMMEWADQNYTEFMKLLSKTLTPAINNMNVNASGPVQIVCPIGRSALDDSPELSPDGLALKDVTPT